MKKILALTISLIAIGTAFTGCGSKDESSSKNDNAGVVTSHNSKENENFNDVDKNHDGILGEDELKKGAEDIVTDVEDIGKGALTIVEDAGKGVETILEDAGDLAKDIVSDVIPHDGSDR